MEIIIPEVIILSSIKTLLKIIRDDYINESDKTKTHLNKILGTLNLERYTFLTQAIKVLVADEDDPRFLDVNMFFNAKRASIPTIHIILQAEQTGGDGIGIDEGFQAPIVDDDTKVTTKVYTRRFNSNAQLVITSDNTNEVVLVYAFLKALLIPLITHLELSGLEKIQLSGNEINIPAQLAPNIFSRQIGISFQYDMHVGDFIDYDFNIKKLIFEQDPNILGNVEIDQSGP